MGRKKPTGPGFLSDSSPWWDALFVSKMTQVCFSGKKKWWTKIPFTYKWHLCFSKKKKRCLKVYNFGIPPILNFPWLKNHLFQLQCSFRFGSTTKKITPGSESPWKSAKVFQTGGSFEGEILKVPSSQTALQIWLLQISTQKYNEWNSTVFLRYVFLTVFPCLKTAAKQKKKSQKYSQFWT